MWQSGNDYVTTDVLSQCTQKVYVKGHMTSDKHLKVKGLIPTESRHYIPFQLGFEKEEYREYRYLPTGYNTYIHKKKNILDNIVHTRPYNENILLTTHKYSPKGALDIAM